MQPSISTDQVASSHSLLTVLKNSCEEGGTAALLRYTFPEATAWDWGLYWGGQHLLILLCPLVQRESEKASPMDVEGKMPERATNRPSAIFLQEGVGRVPRNMGCLGLLVILLGLLVVWEIS